MKTIKDVDIAGKRVFIRCDFNVPLDENDNITDDRRIRETLPTIRYAIDERARVILASHLGRPHGSRVPHLSLLPIAKRLSTLLGRQVAFIEDCCGDGVLEGINSMAPGDVALLENLRFYKGEEEDSEEFARELLRLFDVYVNDAFGVSHRKHASVHMLPKLAKIAVVGFLLKKEIDSFKTILTNPKRPFVAVVGGSKVSGKLGALTNLLNIVDKMIIGGAMCFTFLRAQGYSVGSSLVEEDLVEEAKNIMETARERDIYLYLPVDFTITQDVHDTLNVRKVAFQEIPEGWVGVDVGPATVQLFSTVLSDARSIVWNGPMGIFEIKGFDKGTKAMARVIASSEAISIVGGGETADAVERAGVSEDMTFISTGGGASLELLEGKVLPAIEVLESKQ